MCLFASISCGLTIACKNRESQLESQEDSNVIQKILASNISSADQIPGLFKEDLKIWTAIYESESVEAHLVSPEQPRIIAKLGNKVIAYIGCELNDSNQAYPECEKIQVGRWSSLAKWNLYELSLPGSRAPDSEIKISQRNPDECVSCHGKPALPIWEPYNIWPGTYGSMSRGEFDVIRKSDAKVKSREHENYLAFRKQIFSKDQSKGEVNARYHQLPWRSKVPDRFKDFLTADDSPSLTPTLISKVTSPNDNFTFFFIKCHRGVGRW